MHCALSFARTVTKMETFSSACVIRVLAFPAGWPSNFSSHSFPQKPMGLEWDWQLPAASSKRTAEPSRQKILTVEERVSQFVYRRRRRITPKRRSSFWRRAGTTAPEQRAKAWEDSCSHVGCVG